MTVKCYGCGNAIQNPPVSLDESLIVVYRDKRYYYFNGQMNVTPNAENIHFHLKQYCIKIRYPMFLPATLVIPPAIPHRQYLTSKHKSDLSNEFGISL